MTVLTLILPLLAVWLLLHLYLAYIFYKTSDKQALIASAVTAAVPLILLILYILFFYTTG